MRKVNLFRASLSTILSVTLAASPLLAADKTAAKRAPAKILTRAKSAIPNKNSLGMMTLEQVAKLSDAMRREYIRTLRQAARDAEMIQSKFNTLGVAALNSNHDMYAKYEGVFSWLMSTAEAQNQAGYHNACLFGSNISKYPDRKYEARNCTGDECVSGRVDFECQPVPCTFKSSGLSGYQCGFTGTGIPPQKGCLTRDVSDRGRYAKKCEDTRADLERRNQRTTEELTQLTNTTLGFDSNTVSPTACKGESGKNLFSRLINNAFSDESYSMLIKAAYFCKSSGQGLPEIPGWANETLSFDAIEKDFTNLSKVADQIFANYVNHCNQEVAPKDLEALRRKIPAFQKDGTIAGLSKGSVPYYQESIRLTNLIAEKRSNPNARITHYNVLEKEECGILFDRRDRLKAKLDTIRGSYPVVGGNPPPGVPPAPYEAVRTYPTGCNTDSFLTQKSAACMGCFIQTTEAVKDRRSGDAARRTNAGAYMASQKYIELTSTMVLACGDGKSNNNVVTTDMMADYTMAFGYCKSDTYEGLDETPEETQLRRQWASSKYWQTNRNKETSPTTNDQFRRVYGMSFNDAKNLFCGNNPGLHGKARYDLATRNKLLADRRARLNEAVAKLGGGTDTRSSYLANCLREARDNANAFVGDMCVDFADPKTTDPIKYLAAKNNVTEAMKKFNVDPPIASFDGACGIPSQVDVYCTFRNPQTNRDEVCKDANRDGKDDKYGVPCGGCYTCSLYKDPGQASISTEDSACANPEGVHKFTSFHTYVGENDIEAYSYRTPNSCSLVSGGGNRSSTPAQQNAGSK